MPETVTHVTWCLGADPRRCNGRFAFEGGSGRGNQGVRRESCDCGAAARFLVDDGESFFLAFWAPGVYDVYEKCGWIELN